MNEERDLMFSFGEVNNPTKPGRALAWRGGKNKRGKKEKERRLEGRKERKKEPEQPLHTHVDQ